jgi:hypothetical protein
MGAPGTTLALSPVESALAQLATEVRAAEVQRAELTFAQRMQPVLSAHGLPVTATVHVVPDPHTPGAWLLFLPPVVGAAHTIGAILERADQVGLTSEQLDAMRAMEGLAFEEASAEPLPPELDPAFVPGMPMPGGPRAAPLRPPPPRPTARRELAAAGAVDLGA